MILKYRILFAAAILCLLHLSLYSQNRTKLTGKAEEGGIIIGEGSGIKLVLLNGDTLTVDKSGFFIAGFDRDSAGEYLLQVNYADGKTEKFNFLVERRVYEEERIDGMKQSFVNPSKKQLERIERETKIIAKKKAKLDKTTTAYFKSGFSLPVNDSYLTSYFGVARILNGVAKAPHNGVDFHAPAGETIMAAADGVVILAEKNFFYSGTFVIVDHGLGLHTMYMHLSKLLVKEGAKVKKGQPIGLSGSTGRSTGAHLHFTAQLFKKRIDPMNLFKLGM